MTTTLDQVTTFRDSVKTICPPWLQGYWGYRFMYSIAFQMDSVAENLKQGVLARMPGYGTTEALQYTGHDRQIERGSTESDDAFIERLQQAIPTWKIAGNAESIFKQLLGAVSPNVPKIRYVVNGVDEASNIIADWVTIEDGVVSYHRSNPSNWDWDGAFVPFRFWIIIYPGVWTMKTWGDGHTWGDGTSWGSSATAAEIEDIRALVGKWKMAGSECKNIIVAGDNSLFDPTAVPGAPMPDGTWGPEYKIVAGTAVPTRETNALYLDGVLE